MTNKIIEIFFAYNWLINMGNITIFCVFAMYIMAIERLGCYESDPQLFELVSKALSITYIVWQNIKLEYRIGRW